MDLVFTLLLAVVTPFYGVASFRRLQKQLAQGVPGARSQAYRRTMLVQCVVVVLLLGHWLHQGRDAAALGLTMANAWPVWLGGGLIAVIAVVFVRTWKATPTDPDLRQAIRSGLGELGDMLPHSRSEWRLGLMLSMLVGVTEEIAFRGFLIWWVAPVLGLWGGMLAVAAVFGIGHLYQGPQGAAKVGVAGAVFGAMYVGTGSLWLAMILHALVDVHAFTLAWLVHRESES